MLFITANGVSSYQCNLCSPPLILEILQDCEWRIRSKVFSVLNLSLLTTS